MFCAEESLRARAEESLLTGSKEAGGVDLEESQNTVHGFKERFSVGYLDLLDQEGKNTNFWQAIRAGNFNLLRDEKEF